MFDRPTVQQAAKIMASDSGEKAVFAGGCNVPFGEPWHNGDPSNIIRYSPNKKSYIIGLGHKAQQGKDTLAAHLIEKLGPRPEGTFGPYFPIDIRRYAFADELKFEVFDYLQAFNFLHPQTGKEFIHYFLPLPEIAATKAEKLEYINKWKIESEEMRILLQRWGTEFRRRQDPDYWVKETLARIQEEKPQVAVITDMRFLNETKICDVQINVVRPIQTSLLPQIPSHQSETELDTFPYPYTIVGETVEDLKRKGFDLVEGLLQKEGLLPRE